MIDTLFTFPIAMVDGDTEEQKQVLGLSNDNEVDIIIGEGKFPYNDFVGLVDRWMPNDESRQRAAERQFDACYVIFSVSGSYLVPWPKERFLSELEKFTKALKKKMESVQVITNKQQMREILDQLPDEDEEEDSKT